MSTDQKYFLGKRVCPNCRRTLGAYKMRQLLVNDRIDSRFPTIALDALTIRPHSSYGPGRAGTRLSHGSIYLSHGSAVRHRQPGSARYTHAAKMSSARNSQADMPVASQSWLPLALGKGRARVVIEESETRIDTDGPGRCHFKRAVCYAVGLAELELLAFD